MFEDDAPSNHTHIVNSLLRRVILEEYQPGTFLPSERALQTEFGVSRPIIREALQTLSAMGVISSSPRKGAIVSSDVTTPVENALLLALSRSGVYTTDVIATRLLIETQVAALAAEKATDAQVRQLLFLCQQFESIKIDADTFSSNNEKEGHQWRELDMKFHVALARATQNPMMVLLIDAVVAIIWDQMIHQQSRILSTNSLREAVIQHKQIADAVAARDKEAAKDAMYTHLITTLANESELQKVKLSIMG
ncbi:MAG: FadR/GntR family transcriptional regulator [Aggregatilineales bacterium]